MKLKITAKCSDLFGATLVTDKGKFKVYDGYVPKFMPGEHYGDYVILDIDVETGKILNWMPPSRKQLTEIFGKY